MNTSMSYNRITTFLVAVAVFLMFSNAYAASQCSDGIDNDSDGQVDFPADS